MLELLAPAGSMEALRAAVQNGADAVYLGADGFNARAGARNFSKDELAEAVAYCHVRGVSVHLTLNTLVTDREMPAAAQLIRTASNAGVDAFIVQDLGIIALCREIAPHIPLHGSTQMTIHNLDGVRRAAALGLSRVVLSRELSRNEIAYICQHSPVEIEIFGHGALCMCYSGQCYFSAMIGRRSGNRGACAQPCRMGYGFGHYEPKHPLSLKDNCLLDLVKDVESLGVASLKLEGRMKRPEYVAIVTKAYRTALSGGVPDYAAVEAAFSRQGFTAGYYRGEKGPDMFGIHLDTPEPRELFAAARATYESGERQQVPVTFYAIVSRGRPLSLAAEDPEGRVCKATGDQPEEARTKPLTREKLEEQLQKTGGTPYYMADCRAVVDDGLSVPASAINALRREVLSQLTALRARVDTKPVGDYRKPRAGGGGQGRPGLSIYISRTEQMTAKVLDAAPEVLYVPLHLLCAQPDLFKQAASRINLCAVLPRIVWDSELRQLDDRLLTARAIGVRECLVGNLGQLDAAQANSLEIRGDFGFNLFNTKAAEELQKLGLISAAVSFELTLPQIRDLGAALPLELIAYGRLPLMITENCIMHMRSGACTCVSSPRLVDRTGAGFPVVRDQDSCRNVILNGQKLYLLDKRRQLAGLGVRLLRLQFTTENPAEVDRIIQDYQTGGSFDPGSCTRGLYTRGVD